MINTLDIQHSRIDPQDYLYLAAKVAFKYRNKHGFERLKDTEIYSIACEHLIRAAQSFKSDRGKFAGFAWKYMSNGILQKFRSQRRLKRSACFSVLDHNKWNNIESRNQSSPVFLLSSILQDYEGETRQDREDKQLVIDHFMYGKKISLLAEAVGVSRQAIHNRINRCLQKLRERGFRLLED